MKPFKRPKRKRPASAIRQSFLIILGTLVVVGLSFFLRGGFTFNAYGVRLFWAGIIFILIGGTSAIASLLVKKEFGIPYNVIKQEDAKKLKESIPAIWESQNRRFNISVQFFVIGLICFGISALLQILFP